MPLFFSYTPTFINPSVLNPQKVHATFINPSSVDGTFATVEKLIILRFFTVYPTFLSIVSLFVCCCVLFYTVLIFFSALSAPLFSPSLTSLLFLDFIIFLLFSCITVEALTNVTYKYTQHKKKNSIFLRYSVI